MVASPNPHQNLPNGGGTQDDLQPQETDTNVIEISEDSTSSASEEENEEPNEIENPYAGYQQLPEGGFQQLPAAEVQNSETGASASNQQLNYSFPVDNSILQDFHQALASANDCHLKLEDFPVPLQTPEVPLEEEKSAEIRQRMANFSIPDSNIPDWAKKIPEDAWKFHLMTKIAEMQNGAAPKNSEDPKSN